MKRSGVLVAAAVLLAVGGIVAWRSAFREPAPTPEQIREDRLEPPPADAAPSERAAYEKKVADIAAGRDPLKPPGGAQPDSALRRRLDDRRSAAQQRAEEIRVQALERVRVLRERRPKDPDRKPPASLPDLGPAVVEEKR
jgi:hypothetical protein